MEIMICDIRLVVLIDMSEMYPGAQLFHIFIYIINNVYINEFLIEQILYFYKYFI